MRRSTIFWRRPGSRGLGVGGQASVELLALLPLLLMVALACWQVVVAGQTWWSVSEGARLAARTADVRTSTLDRVAAVAAATADADAVLSKGARKSRKLSVGDNGVLTLRARVPLVAPFAAVIGDGPWVSAQSEFKQ